MLDLLSVMWKKECKHTVIVAEVGMGKTVSLNGNTSTTTREAIWEAMKQPMQQDEYIPSMILLLDGLNEIKVETRELLQELLASWSNVRGPR